MSDHAWTIPMWVRLSAPGLVLVGAATRTLAPVHDPDTWWHIRSGDQLLRTWVFAGPDPWGTFATREWIRHEWLVDLVFGRATAWGGLPGVAWLLPLMTVAVTGCLYAAARRRASILVSALVAVTALLAMSASLSLRPQVVSFAFATVVTAAWCASLRDDRVRWWLAGATWVWACCHGFWVLAPVIGGLALLGAVAARTDRRTVLRMAVLVGLQGVAGAVTPVGPRLLLAPFQVSSVTPYLQEWQRSPVTSVPFLAGLTLVALPVVVLVSRRTSVDWGAALLLALALALLVLSRRTVGLGAAVAAPLCAAALQSRLRLPREVPTRREVGWLTGLGVAGLAAAALLAPRVAAHPADVPDGLSPALAALPAGSVVCNAYDAGSWLLWAHPGLKPVIDGRTELYSVTQVRDFLAFASGSPGWPAYAQDHGCRAVLVHGGSAIAADVAASGDWTARGAADGWDLFESSGPGGAPT